MHETDCTCNCLRLVHISLKRLALDKCMRRLVIPGLSAQPPPRWPKEHQSSRSPPLPHKPSGLPVWRHFYLCRDRPCCKAKEAGCHQGSQGAKGPDRTGQQACRDRVVCSRKVCRHDHRLVGVGKGRQEEAAATIKAVICIFATMLLQWRRQCPIWLILKACPHSWQRSVPLTVIHSISWLSFGNPLHPTIRSSYRLSTMIGFASVP